MPIRHLRSGVTREMAIKIAKEIFDLNSINTADKWYEFKEEFKQLLITKNYYDERLECSTCNRSFRNMAYSGHMRRCGKPSKLLSAHSASAWGDRDRDLSMEYGFVVDSTYPADSLVSNNKKKAKMKDYFINEKNQCHMRELEDLFRSRMCNPPVVVLFC